MSIESPQFQKKDVETPSATDTAQLVEPTAKVQSREGWTRGQRIAAVGSFVAVLAGGAVAANHFSNNVEAPVSTPAEDDNETSAPVATQPVEVSPSASPTNITPLETTPATPNYELSANLPEKELATNIVGLFDEWNSASTTPEVRTTWDRTTTIKDYAASVAAKNTVTYATKLFGPDYTARMASDPIFKTFIEGMEQKNTENIVAFLRTDNTGVDAASQNPNNIEAWQQDINFEEVASYTVYNDVHQLIINCTETDNRHMNIYGGTPKPNPNETLTVSYVKEGAGVRLTAAKFAER